ncbi:MAG TPA: hypothetical protein VN802_03090 [Stellaceae bacterium]|nr:hypothetical protein [Stellaceae bacterium]
MSARARTEEEKEDDVRFTTSLAGLALALFLAVIGLYLLDALAAESKLEDCMMQGRMNCEPIDQATFDE